MAETLLSLCGVERPEAQMLTIERADVRDLRKRLRKAGIFDKDEAKQFRRFSAYSVATLGVLGLLIAAPAVWMQVALVPLIGLLLTPAVMHGHDGAHRSLSKNNSINKWMESLAFGLMGGMSTSWWRWKHNGPHHTHPNLISEDRSDPDIMLYPFATAQADYDRSGPAVRFFQKYVQKWAFWPATSQVHFRMRGQSIVFLAKGIFNEGLKREYQIEVLQLFGHVVLFIALPSLFLGFLPTMAVYLGVWSTVSLLLSIIFIPAHVGMPIQSACEDFWGSQMEGSRNYQAPKWAEWICVGLQYQIEHHLFPTIAYTQLPAASEIVQTWADEKGLPYQSLGWGAALVDATRFMGRAWSVPTL